MYYHGKSPATKKLRDFVKSLINSTEDLLYKKLLFQADNLGVEDIDLNTMIDNMNKSQWCYFFMSEKKNGLQGGQARMMAGLQASSAWKDMTKVETGGIQFKLKVVAKCNERPFRSSDEPGIVPPNWFGKLNTAQTFDQGGQLSLAEMRDQ
jgi:hypothetical protein